MDGWMCDFSTDLFFSYRSWSSQTSLQCFTVFTLFSLPKLLAWTPCLWRATAMQQPLGFHLFPVSPVIHRHQNSNMPLDRCCSLQMPFKKTCGLKWWTGELGKVWIMTLWRITIWCHKRPLRD